MDSTSGSLLTCGIAIGTAIVGLLLVGQSSWEADLGDVRKLIQTNACKDCDLSNAKLSSLDLTDAVLVGANLDGVDLSGANLTRANLQTAVISNANFTGANLSQANLANAKNRDICLSPILFWLVGFNKRINRTQLRISNVSFLVWWERSGQRFVSLKRTSVG